jgi:hypothetical protein
MDVRAELKQLPPLSREHAALTARYDESTEEVTDRARLAWAAQIKAQQISAQRASAGQSSAGHSGAGQSRVEQSSAGQNRGCGCERA